MIQVHPFHMVFLSPWPFVMALLINTLFFGFILIFSKHSSFYYSFFLLMIAFLYQWWRDVARESSLQGFHSTYAFSNMRYGMIFFIVSEILFFVSFFWAFFHMSLSPNVEIGSFWPPPGIIAINPFDVPLLNSVILLGSGVTVTLCHHYFAEKKNLPSEVFLLCTFFLGLYFTTAQIFEYLESSFTLSDSSYGSCFFIATGFHGFHVFVGTIFLLISFFRLKLNHLSNYHHVGLESSIWYWHFVDVVWLFLFTFIYWWIY